MIIKKNSWHFKLVEKMNSNKAWEYQRFNTTLCEYMRTVFFSLLTVFLTVILCLIMGYFLVGAPIYTVVTGVLAPALEGSVLMWLLILFGVLAAGCSKLVDWLMATYQETCDFGKPKQPGIISAYLKARKEKYCPIIKVE